MKTSRAGLVAGRLDPGQDGLAAPPRWTRGRARSRPRRRPRSRGPWRRGVFFSAWKTSAPTRRHSREARGAGRDDHELLEVDRVVGVGAAVEDVHHRHRQHASARRRRRARPGSGRAAGRSRPRPPWPPPARRRGSRWRRAGPCSGCRRARSSSGRGRPARRPRAPVSAAAISPLTLATARETPLPAQASPPSRSSTASNSPVEAPGGHRRQAAGAGLERDFDLDGRVAARVEDLARVDGGDGAHGTRAVYSPRAERSPAAGRAIRRSGRGGGRAAPGRPSGGGFG